MFCMNHNRVTSTEISRVRVTHERTLEISSYCLFTEVYCVLYAAVFGHIRQRCSQGICPTAENLWQNTSAKTRFYRALMGKYFQTVLYEDLHKAIIVLSSQLGSLQVGGVTVHVGPAPGFCALASDPNLLLYGTTLKDQKCTLSSSV